MQGYARYVPWNAVALEVVLAALVITALLIASPASALILRRQRERVPEEVRDEASAAVAEAMDWLGLPSEPERIRSGLIVHNGLYASRR